MSASRTGSFSELADPPAVPRTASFDRANGVPHADGAGSRPGSGAAAKRAGTGGDLPSPSSASPPPVPLAPAPPGPGPSTSAGVQPGSGVLFVLRTGSLTISHASANAFELLGVPAEALVENTLGAVLDADSEELVRVAAERLQRPERPGNREATAAGPRALTFTLLTRTSVVPPESVDGAGRARGAPVAWLGTLAGAGPGYLALALEPLTADMNFEARPQAGARTRPPPPIAPLLQSARPPRAPPRAGPGGGAERGQTRGGAGGGGLGGGALPRGGPRPLRGPRLRPGAALHVPRARLVPRAAPGGPLPLPPPPPSFSSASGEAARGASPARRSSFSGLNTEPPAGHFLLVSALARPGESLPPLPAGPATRAPSSSTAAARRARRCCGCGCGRWRGPRRGGAAGVGGGGFTARGRPRGPPSPEEALELHGNPIRQPGPALRAFLDGVGGPEALVQVPLVGRGAPSGASSSGPGASPTWWRRGGRRPRARRRSGPSPPPCSTPSSAPRTPSPASPPATPPPLPLRPPAASAAVVAAPWLLRAARPTDALEARSLLEGHPVPTRREVLAIAKAMAGRVEVSPGGVWATESAADTLPSVKHLLQRQWAVLAVRLAPEGRAALEPPPRSVLAAAAAAEQRSGASPRSEGALKSRRVVELPAGPDDDDEGPGGGGAGGPAGWPEGGEVASEGPVGYESFPLPAYTAPGYVMFFRDCGARGGFGRLRWGREHLHAAATLAHVFRSALALRAAERLVRSLAAPEPPRPRPPAAQLALEKLPWFALRPDGRVARWSGAMEELTGMPGARLVGAFLGDYVAAIRPLSDEVGGPNRGLLLPGPAPAPDGPPETALARVREVLTRVLGRAVLGRAVPPLVVDLWAAGARGGAGAGGAGQLLAAAFGSRRRSASISAFPSSPPSSAPRAPGPTPPAPSPRRPLAARRLEWWGEGTGLGRGGRCGWWWRWRPALARRGRPLTGARRAAAGAAPLGLSHRLLGLLRPGGPASGPGSPSDVRRSFRGASLPLSSSISRPGTSGGHAPAPPPARAPRRGGPRPPSRPSAPRSDSSFALLGRTGSRGGAGAGPLEAALAGPSPSSEEALPPRERLMERRRSRAGPDPALPPPPRPSSPAPRLLHRAACTARPVRPSRLAPPSHPAEGGGRETGRDASPPPGGAGPGTGRRIASVELPRPPSVRAGTPGRRGAPRSLEAALGAEAPAPAGLRVAGAAFKRGVKAVMVQQRVIHAMEDPTRVFALCSITVPDGPRAFSHAFGAPSGGPGAPPARPAPRPDLAEEDEEDEDEEAAGEEGAEEEGASEGEEEAAAGRIDVAALVRGAAYAVQRSNLLLHRAAVVVVDLARWAAREALVGALQALCREARPVQVTLSLRKRTSSEKERVALLAVEALGCDPQATGEVRARVKAAMADLQEALAPADPRPAPSGRPTRSGSGKKSARGKKPQTAAPEPPLSADPEEESRMRKQIRAWTEKFFNVEGDASVQPALPAGALA
eukprot:tig00000692_g3197.t1